MTAVIFLQCMPSWTRASRGNGRDIYAVQAQLNQMSLHEFPPMHFEASRLISAMSNPKGGNRAPSIRIRAQ